MSEQISANSADESAAREEHSPESLPLDAWHRAQDARMVPFAGYWMPIQYEGIMAEHEWTRNSASLFDVSHMGQLYISGKDPQSALEAVLPADLATLGDGNLRYSLLLNAEGGVLDDLMVTRWSEGFYLVVNGATKWDDIAHLREHLPDEVTISHLEDSALLALQGPQAFTALDRLVEGDTPLSSLGFMSGAAFTLAGVNAWISRSGYTGEDGFEISIPAQNASEIAGLLTAQEEIRPAGLGARDSLRLEAGLPLYGHDLDETTDPVSAGLTFALSKSRRETGGWPGHGQIMQIMQDGPARKRIGMAVEGRLPAREGARIFAGKDHIGVVTSGGFSPTLGHPVAMGYVASDHASPGTKLDIEVRGKRLAAQVVKLPFVPHHYYRKENV
ncbi:MAG: glycine cleavage system aminomethyltransferase GcvT [Sphingomonadaceae bacterium]